MTFVRKKWLTLSFYQERESRKAERKNEKEAIRMRPIRKRESDKVGHCLWKIHQLSTPEDWGKSLRFNANFVAFEDFHLHVSFIPKCCCTSLTRITLEHYYGERLPEALVIRKKNDKYQFSGSPYNYWPEYSHEMFYEKRATVKSIAFVRNPYRRLVSCFRNKVLDFDVQGNAQATMPIPQTAKESFENFVRFACGQHNTLRNVHYTSQWFHLTPGMTVFMFIGYVEHFSEHAHMLFSELGASKQVLDNIDVRRNGSGKYDWKDYYNEELASLVHQGFFPDFEAFGYHKDSWKKDFEVPEMEPIRNYDPAKDIERFRAYFPMEETVT